MIETQRFAISELTFTQTNGKIEEASAFTCKQHSLIIYLKEKKQRYWLKIIVLNNLKFNLHFKIKIRYQINIVKTPVLARGQDSKRPTIRNWDNCENLQLSIRSGSMMLTKRYIT